MPDPFIIYPADLVALEGYNLPRLKGVAWSCGVWRFTVSLWALFSQITSSSPSSIQYHRHRPLFSDPSIQVSPPPDGPPVPALIRRLIVPLLLLLHLSNIAYLTGIAFQQTTLMKIAIIFQVIVQATLALGLLGIQQSAPVRYTMDIVIDSALVLVMGMYSVTEEQLSQKALKSSVHDQ